MSPETPFETRYFSVKLDTDGNVTETDTSKVVAVDDALAVRYAKNVMSGKKETGYISTYRFMRSETENGHICVFVDANRELESFSFFLVSSLLISLLGILVVFVIVISLSDVALKPIIESYEKQKRFITDAGHEMKTPLTVITANTEIIELEGGESQWTQGIKSQVSKLASLTEKLVILSKMEEGAKLDMVNFSLSDALFDTCAQYRSIAISKDVSFNLDIIEGVSLLGHEGEIRRCASLILDNAFRYADQGGTVEVVLQKYQGNVEMRFTNTTDGVEKGSLDRWFDRFYRTDLSRNSDTGGSGIGLSVVKAIVLAHGGTVKAFSHDGKKVEFVITI
jgi:signal transduction histidine kinase